MTNRYWIGATLVAALGLSIHVYALWSRDYVPLYDLPNHMARHSVEAAYVSGEHLPPFYDVHYRILPNLGSDLTIPFLMQVFDPLTACRIFLSMSVLFYWLGPTLFIWAVGGSRSAAIFASLLWLPFLFSSQFLWGFINYYSGFGLAFVALAHFHWMWSRPRFSVPHGIVHAMLVTALFLWHLAPWGIYGVIMGCRVLADGYAWPNLRKAGLYVSLTIPSLILFGVYFMSRESAERAMTFNWGGITRKLLMPMTLFRTYQMSIDAGTMIAWTVVVVGCFQIRSIFQNGKGWLVLALVLLGVLYVLIPFQLGSTSDTDSRLLPAMLVCLLALLSCVPARRLAFGFAVVGLCIAVRAGGVIFTWNQIGERLDDQVKVMAKLERRCRVFPIILLPEQSKAYPEGHFVMWSVVFKETFVPTMFTYPDQQPISLREPYRTCAELDLQEMESNLYEIDEVKLRSCYDYVWVFNPEKHDVRLPASCVKAFERGTTTLWRVK